MPQVFEQSLFLFFQGAGRHLLVRAAVGGRLHVQEPKETGGLADLIL